MPTMWLDFAGPSARHHTLYTLDSPGIFPAGAPTSRLHEKATRMEHAKARRVATAVSEHSVARPLAVPPPRNRSFAALARQPWPTRMENQSQTRSETTPQAT